VDSEAGLQRAVNKLENLANGFDMRISTAKTKNHGVSGEELHERKLLMDDKIMGQVSNFYYLGFDISYYRKDDITVK
jgi:hypothetical protein